MARCAHRACSFGHFPGFSLTHSINIHSVGDRNRSEEFVCESFSFTFAIHDSTRFRPRRGPRTAMCASWDPPYRHHVVSHLVEHADKKEAATELTQAADEVLHNATRYASPTMN